jgi:NAD(P)-dependent dehydrogenase (short-subunit alcohol dehydrogenase family)
MKGKIIFFTGATSGLGKISALNAAKKGARLIVLARNENKAKVLLDDFAATNKSEGSIEIIEGNLNSFKSLSDAVTEIKSNYDHIDMIVNNAGLMNFEHISTTDGIEETLQVNLLAPYLIFT